MPESEVSINTEQELSPIQTPASSPTPEVAVSPSPTPPVSPRPNTASSLTAKPDYTQYMRIGYAAFDQGDYQTALINFKRALNERPGDMYATKAIANTEAIISRNR
ncbi:tetratricopeptide repeat protein [Coleofasciculus sp.]|uniref:tetratricopeptide repeat protein n=1 Tax=Coleofasciculus sp. TaxID=3100458 RepID=UPI003A3CE7AC